MPPRPRRAPQRNKQVDVARGGPSLPRPRNNKQGQVFSLAPFHFPFIEPHCTALFQPSGRIDQAVQVGGTNVHPAYVADVLAMHSGVREAAVRLMRSDEGDRLKAFIVPRQAGEAGLDRLRTELAAWVGERLTAPERPTVFSFGAQLPITTNGKPADWIIDAWP